MRKKSALILAAGLAGILLFAAGCRGKTGAGGSGQAGGSGEKQAITAELLNSLGLEKGSDGSYRFKETKSITVEVFDRGLDGGRSKPEDNFYTKWIKEGMLRDHNVAVSFVPVGR
jgi:putative aldouronate transport system substrate-binding protein